MKNRVIKPFLKWAGGKTQLIGQLAERLPLEVTQSSFNYVEPFVGGGAILLWLLNTFPNMEKATINDANEDLIIAYRAIASQPEELIAVLEKFQGEFHALNSNDEKRKAYYLDQKQLYNCRSETDVIRAALFIFLNKTCFNGLYRVNAKNMFNVSMNQSRLPNICDRENILSVSRLLQRVEILCGDFEQTLEHVNGKTFFFIDPPYRPLTKTSSFNGYVQGGFDDREQIRLRDFCIKLHEKGFWWMLCNSDGKSLNPDDDFFDRLYHGFPIQRIKANRYINSNGEKRGKITELLITNYR